MNERKYVCPVCGANLKYERIDDDKTVIEIKSDTTMCVEDEISNGSTSVYCSADGTHELPMVLVDEVLDLVEDGKLKRVVE